MGTGDVTAAMEAVTGAADAAETATELAQAAEALDTVTDATQALEATAEVADTATAIESAAMDAGTEGIMPTDTADPTAEIPGVIDETGATPDNSQPETGKTDEIPRDAEGNPAENTPEATSEDTPAPVETNKLSKAELAKQKKTVVDATKAAMTFKQKSTLKDALKLRRKAEKSWGALSALRKNWNKLSDEDKGKYVESKLGIVHKGAKVAVESLGMTGKAALAPIRGLKAVGRHVPLPAFMHSVREWPADTILDLIQLGVLDAPEGVAKSIDESRGTDKKLLAAGVQLLNLAGPEAGLVTVPAGMILNKQAKEQATMATVRKVVKAEIPGKGPQEGLLTKAVGAAGTVVDFVKTTHDEVEETVEDDKGDAGVTAKAA